MTQGDRSAIRVLEGGHESPPVPISRARSRRRNRNRRDRNNDWLKAVVWTAVVAVCVGFWAGVIITILEMSK